MVQADTDKDQDNRVALIQLASSSMVLLIKVTRDVQANATLEARVAKLPKGRFLMLKLVSSTDHWAGLHARGPGDVPAVIPLHVCCGTAQAWVCSACTLDLQVVYMIELATA
jgi:hypothetical protein